MTPSAAPDYRGFYIGSFYSDSTKFRQTTGWAPRVGLRDGLQQTIAFYRAHQNQYIDAEVPS